MCFLFFPFFHSDCGLNGRIMEVTVTLFMLTGENVFFIPCLLICIVSFSVKYLFLLIAVPIASISEKAECLIIRNLPNLQVRSKNQ